MKSADERHDAHIERQHEDGSGSDSAADLRQPIQDTTQGAGEKAELGELSLGQVLQDRTGVQGETGLLDASRHIVEEALLPGHVANRDSLSGGSR